MHTQKTLIKLNIFSLIVLAAAVFGVVLFSSSLVPTHVSAANCNDPQAVDPECVKTKPIKLTPEDTERAGLKPKSANSIVAQTLNGVYGLVAIIAIITIVLAGIRFMTADGDSAKMIAARKTIYYAIVGLAIVGSAFIITGVIQGAGTR